MKTTIPTLECGRRQPEAMEFKSLFASMCSKITDKMCISAGVTAIVVMVSGLLTLNVPVIIASGLTALCSVAMAPMDAD